MKRSDVINLSANGVIGMVLFYYLASIYNIYVAHRTIEGLIYIVVAGAMLFLVQFIFSSSRNFILRPQVLVIYAALLFMFISVLVQEYLKIDEIDFLGRSSLQYIKTTFFLCLSWLMVGFAISYVDYERSTWRGIGLIIIAFAMVVSALDGGLVVSYSYLAQQGGLEALNHLFVGDGLIFIFFLAFSLVRERYRIFVFIAGLAFLFMSGGRTALFFSALSIYFYYLSMARNRTHLVFGGAAIIALLIFVVKISNDNELLDRMLFRRGITTDDSFLGRLQFLHDAFFFLPKQFLFGDPTLIVREYGTIGAYAHNILSAWQFYGFLPFALIVAAILYCTNYIRTNKETFVRPVEVFFVILFFYVLLCVVISKYVGFYHLWMTLGFWLAHSAKRGVNSLSYKKSSVGG